MSDDVCQDPYGGVPCENCGLAAPCSYGVESEPVDPEEVRDCDGYPGLQGLDAIRTRRMALAAQLQRNLDRLGLPRVPRAYGIPLEDTPCCGDPGDCSECGSC